MRWLIALLLVVSILPLQIAFGSIDNSVPITRAVNYLKTKQLVDGGFEGFTPGSSDDFTTLRVALALGTAHYAQSAVTSSGGKTPLDYLRGRAIAYVKNGGLVVPGRAGQLAVAVIAADDDPTNFGGENLIADLQGTYNPATGTYSSGASGGAASITNQMWPILALAGARQPVPTAATDYLLTHQESDNRGGWGYGFGQSDVDLTSQVLMALLASHNVPTTETHFQQGRAFLLGQQLNTGGWPTFDGTLNPDSTAIAIQAVWSMGVHPETLVKGGRTPYDDLISFQGSNGGFSDSALSTADAIPGLVPAPLPFVHNKQRLPGILRGSGF